MRNKKIILHGLTILLILISCEKGHDFEYPLVYTGDVTNITDTNALFSAKISFLGDYPILESGFIWGVHSKDNNGIKIKNPENVSGIYSLYTNEKLLPGKTFYVRGYVQTENTTSYGREVSFESPKGQINTGRWSQMYNDYHDYGSEEFIRASFTINDITYFAFANGGLLYSYNPTTNTFKYELSNPLLSIADLSVVYNGHAYIFSLDAFYRFDPQLKSFYKLATFSDSKSKYEASGFLIEDNIYIGLGRTSGKYSKDFWKYSITSDSWEQVASFPGNYRRNGFSFSINNIGYVGGGFNDIGNWPYPKFNDSWCYIPESDKWIQKESLPFKNEELFDLQGTNTEEFGYCFYHNQFYEYNPIFDIWEKMADLDIGFILYDPHIFWDGSKIYILDPSRDYLDEIYFKMWVYEK